MGAGERDVVWAPAAYTDLDQILAQLDAPLGLLEEVLQAAESLSTLSERGRIVPELDEPVVREIFVTSASSTRFRARTF